MKKFIALFLMLACVLTLTLSFTSCASIDKFTYNLGDDYAIFVYTADDEIELLFEEIFDSKFDKNDYGVKKVIEAEDGRYDWVVIFECKSFISAKKFAKDIENDYIKEIEDASIEYDGEVQRKGKYVLFGNKSAVNDALGE